MRARALLLAAALVGCAAPAEDVAEGEGALSETASFAFVSAENIGKLVHVTDPVFGTVLFPRPRRELRDVFERRISPPLEGEHDGFAAYDYARRMGPLGYFGPLGAYGPLGAGGPVGGSVLNPDLFISGIVPWSDWSELLTKEGGPLSAKGPLGSTGPLNPKFWDELPKMLHERIAKSSIAPAEKAQLHASLAEGFATHLKPGGLFSVLGPAGVSGALGPLGPLGTIGAHGLVARNGGDWHPSGSACPNAPDSAKVPPCRKIDVDWEDAGEKRTYGLFEVYSDAHAKAFDGSAPDRWNDTSFMVEGRATVFTPDVFLFRSEETQWVTVAVLPESARYTRNQAVTPHLLCSSVLEAGKRMDLEPPPVVFLPSVGPTCLPSVYDHRGSHDDFDLELEIEHEGKHGTIASRSRDLIDWIEVEVPAGTVMTAKVTSARTWFDPLVPRVTAPAYRLVVVGSTHAGRSETRFEGPYRGRVDLR